MFAVITGGSVLFIKRHASKELANWVFGSVSLKRGYTNSTAARFIASLTSIYL